MIRFSALVSVYAKENPDFFLQCLNSLLSQSVLPDELIIVKDGPLTDELELVLANLKFEGKLIIIALPENVTQGPARASGIAAASCEWVAIMDSDDICCRDRFEKQIRMIEDNPLLGIVGGQIDEFVDLPTRPVSFKLVPEQHRDILRYAKKRNPFNHMTLMLKRDLVTKVGNYAYFPGFEDYDLMVRLLNNGAICANHHDVLVHARVGNGMYGRRRGFTYIRSEWQMQLMMKRIGFINNFELLVNMVMRLPVRLLPSWAIEFIYIQFARRGRQL